MPEIKFDPFLEEEAFTADSLNNRFNDVADGINDIVADGIAEGALTDVHLNGGVVLVDTIEIPFANPATGFYFCDTTGGMPGAGTCYYNGPGPAWDSLTADGDWTPIVDSAGQGLELFFNPVPMNANFLSRHGVDGILVHLNVEVALVTEQQEVEEELKVTGPGPDMGLAIALQANLTDGNWYHIRNAFGANNSLRTRRTLGPAGGQTASQGQWIWADVPIRTLLTKDDLDKWTLLGDPGGDVRGVRAVISIIVANTDRRVEVKLRNANLSVFLLRSVLV